MPSAENAEAHRGAPSAVSLSESFARAGVRGLVLRGGGTAHDLGGEGDPASIQFLVAPEDARRAAHSVEPTSWRYSWADGGLLRFLPWRNFWWDGGSQLDLYWGLPAAPMPSAFLGALARELWAGAERAPDGLLRPAATPLLVHYAVQACRSGAWRERDWSSFIALRTRVADMEAARAVAKRVGVSRALDRALAAAEAGAGPPGRGLLYDGPTSVGWKVASAIQSRAPGRLRHLLAGAPSLGDATIRCRFGNVEVLAGPGVFVPTPDADIFIEMSMERLRSSSRPVVLELGTGCGAIALAIASARHESEVHATELSRTAIQWAIKSARHNELGNVQFHTGPLLEPVPSQLHGRVDLIVANLPFYPAREYAPIGSVPRDTIQGEDEDGLGLLRELVRNAPTFLRPDGSLILQMFEWQWPVLAAELTALGYRPGSPRVSGPFAICPVDLIRA